MLRTVIAKNSLIIVLCPSARMSIFCRLYLLATKNTRQAQQFGANNLVITARCMLVIWK